MITEFAKVYDRDINRLKQEIESFKQEKNLWVITGAIKNSSGNLCLHLIGNLRTYIGKNMGNQDYVRDRDAEFNLKGIERQELLQQIDMTRAVVGSTFANLKETSLKEFHIEEVLGYPMTNAFFLIHLTAHFSYHLGQINYLRRALES